MKTWHYYLGWIVAWGLLVGTTIACRPFIPINETRYIGVAWEMWLHHQFLVPILNGIAYPDKPPLLFWLTNAGWLLTGINDYWPRIVVPLFALFTTFLTYSIAKRLWPEDNDIRLTAPTILTGCLFWAFYLPNFRFDIMLTFFAWLAIYGMLLTSTHWRRGWLLTGISVGLGILAKGPVILLFALPVMLLAPWWNKQPSTRWTRYYLWCGIAVVIGVGIALAWAIPAAISGGKQFANAIFFSQTVSRLTGYHTHVWDYLPQLPVLLAPWLIWPTFWVSLANLRKQPLNDGLRFSMTALFIPFIILSLITEKGLRYLIPLFPAFALFAAASLRTLTHDRSHRFAQWPISAIIYLGGLAISAIPFIHYHYPTLIPLPLPLNPLWGILLMMIATVWIVWQPEAIKPRITGLSMTMVLVMTIFFLSVQKSVLPNYDIRPMASVLATLENKQQPIAHIGHYDDEYHFYGRLKKPFVEIQVQPTPTMTTDQYYALLVEKTRAWAKQHPTGWVIAEWPTKRALPVERHLAYYWQGFRKHEIAIIWPATAFNNNNNNEINHATSHH